MSPCHGPRELSLRHMHAPHIGILHRRGAVLGKGSRHISPLRRRYREIVAANARKAILFLYPTIKPSHTIDRPYNLPISSTLHLGCLFSLLADR